MMVGFEFRGNPGKWRPGAIYVRREPENEVVYEGPDVELVPPLMEEMMDELNSESSLAPMIKAAMAHLNLVMIHPFSDGNGRMARALQTMVLSREGIVDKNLCSIEEYLGRNTLEYYAVLGEVGQGSWNPDNNPLPWIRFCLTAHYRQAETLLRRMKEIARVWDGVEVEIKKRKMNERMIIALVNAAMGFRVRNSNYRIGAEVSDQVAGKDLRILAAEGFLVPQGERRGRFYLAGRWLRELRSRSREAKVVTDPFSQTKKVIPPPKETTEPYLPGLTPMR